MPAGDLRSQGINKHNMDHHNWNNASLASEELMKSQHCSSVTIAIWADADQDLCHHITSLALNEFTKLW